MPSYKAWFLETDDLIKSERKRKHFNWKWSREAGIEANIDTQPISLFIVQLTIIQIMQLCLLLSQKPVAA
jgi:hypothetical protein